MSATEGPQYRVRDGDIARDREAVLAVWRGNLGQDARMARKYDWFYGRAPSGAPLLQLLEHEAGAAPVGVCAAGRRRMSHRGQPLCAGVLVDLAVAPDHRSLGPALMLQQGLFAAGKRELDLLYGFPNPKAAPVFKRIGYRKFADMTRYARVVRHASYARRRLAEKLPAPLAAAMAAMAGPAIDLLKRLDDARRWPAARRYRVEWHERAPDIESLWRDSAKPDALTAVRDAAYLRWRFDEAPDARFRHLLLRDGDTSCAWFATTHDDHTLQVHDFWTLDGATPAPEIIAALLRAAYAMGHATVSLELATSAQRLQPWLTLGFSDRGQRPLFGYWAQIADGSPDLHIVSADEDE
ncbi:MAG: hypothetical protein E6Q88_01145 [Lysobacteraceae bacterium]|nr:MAG: hypothetical protein E6Q88_01145 [Xanthomonadaceae bacterium]